MLFKTKLNWSELENHVDALARHGQIVSPPVGPPFLENATKPVKNLTTKGYRECAGQRVWLVEVGKHENPLIDNQHYDIDITHGPLKGLWGRADSYAFIKYSFSNADRTSIRLMGVYYACNIRMKPKSEYKPIEDFAPLYARLKDEFKGDVDAFARHVVSDTHDEYRSFAVLKSVLFHEYLHYRLAQIDGKLRYPDLKKKVHSLGYATDEHNAVDRLMAVTDDTFYGWGGEIKYKPSHMDHRFIWEEEFKYLVRLYEREVLKK